MSTATALVRRLYGLPGSSATDTGGFLKQAAAAHEELFRRACDPADSAFAVPLAPVAEYLDGRAPPAHKERLLNHPLFLEGLHGLAPCRPKLRHWHETVTAKAAVDDDPAAPLSLGNVALVCRLHGDTPADGEFRFCTDVLGRLAFPFCDWSLTLHIGPDDWLGRQLIKLRLDGGHACWQLDNSADEPFLVLSADDCRRLLLGNADPRQFRLEFPNARFKPRLQCSCSLGHGPMRYDPVGFQDFEAHAGLTGALVKHLLTALHHHAPAVYREFRTFVHTVRGFEFPESAHGVVGSFSDPTLPGVMGINVPYTPGHEARLDPFCFTWLGHELGHTKNYLSDNILYGRGLTLLRNPAERTPTVPRYGRPLSVRTLFQVPYVHLYEWTLLMDFWQAGFRGLPWDVPDSAAEVGEDLDAEIAEAFGLIEAYAELTTLGESALRHFKGLFTRTRTRWHSLRPRGRSSA